MVKAHKYVTGSQVDDHVEALYQVAMQGKVGETYNIGGHNEIMNIDVVKQICGLIDQLAPKDYMHEQLITYVKDRQAMTTDMR